MPGADPRAVATLRRAGLVNPLRLARLIRRSIDFFALDLAGRTVLTEAASGAYVVTPVIAALAGASRVIALTRDSRYATADEVVAQTRAIEVLCGVAGRVEIVTQRDLAHFAAADIVTNLGFVRPVDGAAVAAMRPSAVVPLMCEAWEIRPGDVDIAACLARGISVAGTNEDFPGLDVFANSGWLCQKMLFEAQIELHKSVIIVVSSDKFGVVIARHLAACGVSVRSLPDLRDGAGLEGADAIVVADYRRGDEIIGRTGDITPEALVRAAPAATVVQFAGLVDVDGLLAAGGSVFPGTPLPPHRMAQTLAAIGPRTVVELHTAGLKVGELTSSAAYRRTGAVSASARGYQDLLQPVRTTPQAGGTQ